MNNQEIELEVRRLVSTEEISLSKEIASQVQSHREFLQNQFRTVTWSIGVIVAAVVTAGSFFVGRELTSIQRKFDEEVARSQQRLASQVDDAMIRYAIKSELREELSVVLRGLIKQEEGKLTSRIQSELLVETETTIRNFAHAQNEEILAQLKKEVKSGTISKSMSETIEKLSKQEVATALAQQRENADPKAAAEQLLMAAFLKVFLESSTKDKALPKSSK